MPKRLSVVDIDLCVGCQSCMFACNRRFAEAGLARSAIKIQSLCGYERGFVIKDPFASQSLESKGIDTVVSIATFGICKSLGKFMPAITSRNVDSLKNTCAREYYKKLMPLANDYTLTTMLITSSSSASTSLILNSIFKTPNESVPISNEAFVSTYIPLSKTFQQFY